jgi:hypothetical protein
MERILAGTEHMLPKDIRDALRASPKTRTAWESMTPLARNEWICWVTIVKKADTRKDHLKRMIAELEEGKRRPCCWPGCQHRNPASAKWFGSARKVAKKTKK